MEENNINKAQTVVYFPMGLILVKKTTYAS